MCVCVCVCARERAWGKGCQPRVGIPYSARASSRSLVGCPVDPADRPTLPRLPARHCCGPVIQMWDLYTRQRIDTAVDVWALGVLLYVLAFGKLPFPGDSKLAILYGKYDMPPGRPAAMRALIQDMLQVCVYVGGCVWGGAYVWVWWEGSSFQNPEQAIRREGARVYVRRFVCWG